MKIEIVQDSELLGFHHVHLRVADPAATLQWFNDRPGGAERDARDSESGD